MHLKYLSLNINILISFDLILLFEILIPNLF